MNLGLPVFASVASTALYALSLHDALPISALPAAGGDGDERVVRDGIHRAVHAAHDGRSGGGHPLGDVIRTETGDGVRRRDRKSTRLNSSHTVSSYAVFCLKKKNRALPGRDESRSPCLRFGGVHRALRSFPTRRSSDLCSSCCRWRWG